MPKLFCQISFTFWHRSRQMIRLECQNEKCGETYYAERSSSRFCKPSCRTAQHKLDKKREKTVEKLTKAFPDMIEHIDALEPYGLKNQFLDMAALVKTTKIIPMILDMIWLMNESVATQKGFKIENLEYDIENLKSDLSGKAAQIETSIDFRKTMLNMLKSSLADDGVQSWQM